MNCNGKYSDSVMISKFHYAITTIMDKISETGLRLYVEQQATGKVQYLVSSNFSLVSTKCLFWEKHW